MCLALFLAGPLGCADPAPPSVAPAPPVSAAPAVRPRARIRKVVGEVRVKRAAGDDWIAARPSLALFENDKVRTAAGASAEIELANGSAVSIAEDALLSIAESRGRLGQDRADLTVHKGRIDAELGDPEKQSFTVTTPAATVRAGREIAFQ